MPSSSKSRRIIESFDDEHSPGFFDKEQGDIQAEDEAKQDALWESAMAKLTEEEQSEISRRISQASDCH